MGSDSDLPVEIKLLKTLYQEGRQVLEKDLQGLDLDALDWLGLDDHGVVNIASQIVHIAGFDNLVRSALIGEDLTELVKRPEWQEKYNCGFPRELNVAPPKGKKLEYYLGL